MGSAEVKPVGTDAKAATGTRLSLTELLQSLSEDWHCRSLVVSRGGSVLLDVRHGLPFAGDAGSRRFGGSSGYNVGFSEEGRGKRDGSLASAQEPPARRDKERSATDALS